ncbi:MAG: 2-keto-4-pentenoate hydratase [Pseudomonadota bacterium]
MPDPKPSSDVLSAAEALRSARANRRAIAPISSSHKIAGLEQAYAVAALNTEHALASGRVISGKKIGLTSKAVQQQLGVDRPDYGVLFADMEFHDGDELPTSRLMQPKAEGEVAFVVGRDLTDARLTWGGFLLGLEYALPALEIVDSAIVDWKITLVDTVADNASCGLYVLGTEPRRICDLNLLTLGMHLARNGETVSVGSGAACLGHPLKAAYWLAKTMAELEQPLKAGDVILSGALGPMFTFQSGDELALDLGPLGRVQCRTH